jgi:hypothetical protein
VRAPTPHEQAAIFGATYALTLLVLRAWGLRRARRRAQGQRAWEWQSQDYYLAPNGDAFVGSPEWVAAARAKYGADNPTAN